MACDKCAKPTSDTDSICCQGLCTLPVHLKCAGLNSSQIKAKAENKNLIWVCDECSKLLKNAAFRRALGVYESVINDMRVKQSDAIAELKAEISKTNQKLDKIANPRPSFLSPRIANPWPDISIPTTKRRRVENFVQAPSVGTKKTAVKSVATVPSPEKKFWIYLGRLHNQVTSKDIEELVMECLQCETADVHLLVRKDVDLTQLKSVSFKVGVNLKFKDEALSAATWPAGVLFREFEDIGSKNVTTPAAPNSSTPNLRSTRSTTLSRTPNAAPNGPIVVE